MTYNIIGDVAGRFDELIALLTKMPKSDKTILLGDIIDRGPKSAQVIEWAMNNPDVITIKGNHEDMMIDFFYNTNRYDKDIWKDNGGDTTLKSYPSNEEGTVDIPIEQLEWLKTRPIFFQDEGLYCSHAPWDGSFQLGHYKNETDMIWNRYKPKEREGIFQIFGHNTSLRQYGNYAICIDNSGKKVLTGLHWPTKQLFEEKYHD